MGTAWIGAAFLVSCFICYMFCEENVGPGRWYIEHMSTCEFSENNIIQTNITKKRISREQDGFTGSLDMGMNLTKDLSMSAEICTHVDGGCKPYLVITHDSFCSFMEDHMPDLFEEVLLSWGVSPPVCPVIQNIYTVEEYPFNYTRLKRDSMYGLYETTAILRDGQTEVLCLKVIVSFTKEDEEE